MSVIWLIARREFLERIRTKIFLLATLCIPVLLCGFLGIDALLVARIKIESRIAIASSDTEFAGALQKNLRNLKNSRMEVEVASPLETQTRRDLDARLRAGTLDGYLWVDPKDRVDVTSIFQYFTQSSLDIGTTSELSDAVKMTLLQRQLRALGASSVRVDEAMRPIEVVSSNTARIRESIASYLSIAAMFFLMYFVILLYGMNVARSVLEEKNSRIFEVLLSSIRARDLLAGKILGVGGAGLCQVLVWLATATFSAMGWAFVHGNGISHAPIHVQQIAYFVGFFLLGYLLYASLAAALGAMSNTEQELQPLSMVLLLPLLFCMIVILPVTVNPNGNFSVLISLIPFCAPLMMYLRICLSQPPLWQVSLSIALLLGAIYVMVNVAARIYEVGILMYGKRPNMPEILRWIKRT